METLGAAARRLLKQLDERTRQKGQRVALVVSYSVSNHEAGHHPQGCGNERPHRACSRTAATIHNLKLECANENGRGQGSSLSKKV